MFKHIREYFQNRKRRKKLKPCAKCGRYPKINNRGDGWYAIECHTRSGYHYGIGFSRGQYIKNFDAKIEEWNKITDDKNKQLDL